MSMDSECDFDSISLEDCQAALDSDGSAHLVFQGVGGGAIAFGVTRESIGALRRELRILEEHLDLQASQWNQPSSSYRSQLRGAPCPQSRNENLTTQRNTNAS
jgi:hypothetical protein